MVKYLLVFLLSFTVQADTDWARVAMNTATILDWAQTRDIHNHPHQYEENPILGKYPTDAEINRYFIVALLSYNLIGDYVINERYRGYFYGAITLVHTEAVINNYTVGIKFKFD